MPIPTWRIIPLSNCLVRTLTSAICKWTNSTKGGRKRSPWFLTTYQKTVDAFCSISFARNNHRLYIYIYVTKKTLFFFIMVENHKNTNPILKLLGPEKSREFRIFLRRDFSPKERTPETIGFHCPGERVVPARWAIPKIHAQRCLLWKTKRRPGCECVFFPKDLKCSRKPPFRFESMLMLC